MHAFLTTDYTDLHGLYEFFNRQDARDAKKTERQNLARRTRRRRRRKTELTEDRTSNIQLLTAKTQGRGEDRKARVRGKFPLRPFDGLRATQIFNFR